MTRRARRLRRWRNPKQSADPPLLSAALWRRFTSATRIPEDKVRPWQKATKAADAEIDGTIRWVLKNHLSDAAAVHAFQKVLGEKLDDRWLHPICAQVNISEKALRDLLIGRDVKVWARWLKAHPEVRSVK